MGEGWIRPPQVKLVHDAVLAACDAADGAGRRHRVGSGRLPARVSTSARLALQRRRHATNCLSERAGAGGADAALAAAPRTSNWPTACASTRAAARAARTSPSFGPTGGWTAWWLGAAAPALPPQPDNSIAWFYGAGAIQYFYARDPSADLRSYRTSDHAARVREVSALMDSTNPDLRRSRARGGKLHRCSRTWPTTRRARMPASATTSRWSRKHGPRRRWTASCACTPRRASTTSAPARPANVDMLAALADWVERGRAPQGLTLVEQRRQAAVRGQRGRGRCANGRSCRATKGGDAANAASFACEP